MEELLKQILGELQSVNKRMDTLDQNQLRLEGKIENEIADKIRGLYDSREVQADVNERIVSTLDRMEAKIDVLQMETARVRRIK